MPYISHSLGRTYYETNKGSGIPLIGLHGGPGGSCALNNIMLTKCTGRKIYVYDQLGSGRSSKTNKKRWNISTFVEELSILLKKWKLDEFHLMGGSWGTTLALEYYLRKKDKRIKSLIFQSPMFSTKIWHNDAKKLIKKLPRKEQDIIKYCELVGATDAKVYKEVEALYFKKHVLRKKLGKELAQKSRKLFNLNIYEYMWGATEFNPTGTLKSYDRTVHLKKIKIPTLFICGEHDEATPASCRKFQRQVPGAKLVVLKGCSHVSQRENPQSFFKHLNQFLHRHDT